MSSDITTFIQDAGSDRLQGMQPQAPQVSAVAKPGEVERNESAARGQDMPLRQAEQAGTTEDAAEVESAVSQISEFVQNFQRDLRFSIDEDSDRLVVKVVDSETQEVIRQIPSEETLRIAKNLDTPESVILREQA